MFVEFLLLFLVLFLCPNPLSSSSIVQGPSSSSSLPVVKLTHQPFALSSTLHHYPPLKTSSSLLLSSTLPSSFILPPSRSRSNVPSYRRAAATQPSALCNQSSSKTPSSSGVRSLSMMFENFTEQAIKVIMLAQEESRRGGHNFVGTEQLFLGLLGQGTGLAAVAMASLGLNLREMRHRLEHLVGKGSGFVSPEVPFTSRAKHSLERALEASRQCGHAFIDTQHLLLGVLKEEDGSVTKVLSAFGIEKNKLKVEIMKKMNIGGGGGRDNNQVQSVEDQLTIIGGGRKQQTTTGGGGLNSSDPRGGAVSLGTPTLSEYSIDLTEKAKLGELDPVVGRVDEIDRVIQILARRTKSNPILIGEPGVGKTAIAEGLAQRIMDGDVPTSLEQKRVCVLDLGLLVAGTKYRGEFEDRVKKVLEEVRKARNVILVIDEIHTIIGAGAGEGALDAANLLKPALARSDFQCIGATTFEEYKKHFERDSALERRFQPVAVKEPSTAETIKILRTLAPKYEQFHRIKYTPQALVMAAKYSEQYIADRYLPDKAIDLMDEAASSVKIRHTKRPHPARAVVKRMNQLARDLEAATAADNYETVLQLQEQQIQMQEQLNRYASHNTAHDRNGKHTPQEGDEKEDGDELVPVVDVDNVAEVVSTWTGIPIQKLTASASSRLLAMEGSLHERVVGQDLAVAAVSRAIRRAKTGLKNPNRPIASFLFCGPTGVGKSELAKSLAEYLFDSEDAMVRLDMSEYMERFSVSKLIGSPPGYVGYDEGGQLTEAVRRRPYAVVLFDEIEKAHPDVFNALLQIIEEGRLTDAKGRAVDFKNCLLILTSNIGSKVIERAAAGAGGFGFDTMAEEELAGGRVAGSVVDGIGKGDGGDRGVGGGVGEEGEEEKKERKQREGRYRRIKALVNEELKNYFRPEFLNRMDECVVFEQLSRDEVASIAGLLLDDVVARCLAAHNITMVIRQTFLNRLIQEGYDPVFGARPLRRAVVRLLEDNVAEALLTGRIKTGDNVIADLHPTTGEVLLRVHTAAPNNNTTTAVGVPSTAAAAAEGTSEQLPPPPAGGGGGASVVKVGGALRFEGAGGPPPAGMYVEGGKLQGVVAQQGYAVQAMAGGEVVTRRRRKPTTPQFVLS
eukprot:GHVS01052696.1.p1 GENE.GHVS01052696.1~~GHVS01052696.1.p1  ORF type:complete len:1128 (+),score=314.86 GHVS01052696.1:129-3512(+)